MGCGYSSGAYQRRRDIIKFLSQKQLNYWFLMNGNTINEEITEKQFEAEVPECLREHGWIATI